MGTITMDTTGIQRILRISTNNYMPKLENLEEMDKFLGTYNLPKLNHEDSEDQNRLSKDRQNRLNLHILQQRKPRRGQVHYQILPNLSKTNINPSQTMRNNKKESFISNSFYKANIILVSKPEKSKMKKSSEH